MKTILMIVANAIVSAVVAFAVVHVKSLDSGVLRVPIAVMDVDALTQAVDPRSPDYAQRMSRIAQLAAAKKDELLSQGVIILDRAQIIAAPQDAYVDILGSSK